MSDSAFQLAYLRDPRLSAHATSAAPAWLWAADGGRILWANAVGAAIFDAPGPAALAVRRFDAKDPAAIQIMRIAATLPTGRLPRLERLRGFGMGFARALMCACSRIVLTDNSAAILVTAVQSAGPPLPLAERVRRLIAGIDAPIAIFSMEGALLHATTPALDRLDEAATLSFLGAEALAAEALRAGQAFGPSKAGPLSIERIGKNGAMVLIVTLDAAPGAGAIAASPALPAHADSASPVPAVSDPDPGAALPERRHPLRFVWRMDAGGRFNIESGDFVRLTGQRTAEVLGRPWDEIAASLGLDPEGRVTQSLASRDTWSGITIEWPVDGTDERLAVELSGLPVFDRDRAFGGYRGFGVCRDARRISIAASLRYPAPAPPLADEAPAVADPSADLETHLTPDTPADTKSVPLPAEERPVFTVVPAAKNVVPFRSSSATERTPSLSPVERKAFRELARQLTTRLQASHADTAPSSPAPPAETDDFADQPPAGSPIAEGADRRGRETPAMGLIRPRSTPDGSPPFVGSQDRTILDVLPVGVLVYRLDTLLYANPAFLDWTGHDSVAALTEAGGLDNLFVEPGAKSGAATGDGQALTVSTNRGDRQLADGRLFSVPWEGEAAHVLVLAPSAVAAAPDSGGRHAQESRELKAILDTATDGVVVLDREGKILSSNRSAEALFGYDAPDLIGMTFSDLFARESRRPALDYLAGLMRNGVARVLNDGREVIGRTRQGGLIPLFMTVGQIADAPQKFCAVFRDLTHWKKTEEDLINAKRQAEKASTAKSEFLAKISHEIRTPLNAIIGFSEVMMGERFGPIANDRYREYLKDIHTSGGHLVSLLNDLLDLSKIEAGKVDLTFVKVSLNELTQQCVALMQPQANQERIIIRTSLPPVLPQIMADARSVRQIILNLVSNSIKFTGAGGQVIVSTAQTDGGAVVLRVRDTGVGMSENDIQTALEPFRQLATSARWGSGGTGLGLPLTKALAEANQAYFSIKSAVNAGTLVEICFPPTRVLAE
jgi:PAS domain S-box-containing protein